MPANILVVEDDPDISKAISFILRKLGHKVQVAFDGPHGLEAAMQKQADLVILDLFLPGIAGEEICKAIREHDDEKLQKTPIIMLTAKTMDADRIVGKVIGANCYITKPFDMDFLLSQVQRLTAA